MNMDKTQTVKSDSMLKIIESLRNFLMESKIYEALPQNSEVIILDKTFSCYDTFEIIFSNDCEDVVTWNSEISNFDGLITYSDICDILLFLFKNVMTKKNNIQIFKEKKNITDVKFVSDETIEEEQFEIEEEMEGGSTLKPRIFSNSLEGSDKNLFNLLGGLHEINFMAYNEEIKNKLIFDLKAVTLKNWTHKFYSELFQNYNLISMDIDKNLYEVCDKIINERLHRLIIMDKESQVVVGTITQRDILLFIVRNFKSESNDDGFNTPIGQLGWLPSMNILTVKENTTVFNAFALLIENKLSAIPVVDQKDAFLGFIQKNDIVLVIKDDRYELLSKTCVEFLFFLKEVKKKFKALAYEGNVFFSPVDSLKLVVEKILFSPGNRLICINETNKICGIITLTDLFNFYLKSV